MKGITRGDQEDDFNIWFFEGNVLFPVVVNLYLIFVVVANVTSALWLFTPLTPCDNVGFCKVGTMFNSFSLKHLFSVSSGRLD